MKFVSKKQKRNTRSQFFYLPHPTFLIIYFDNGKHYYKCFVCKKLFPTKYRLSMHFFLSRCLSGKNIIDRKKIRNLKVVKKFKKLNIQYSDFSIYNKEFLLKQNDMLTLYPSRGEKNDNTSIINNELNDLDFQHECRKISINILNNTENFLGGGHFCNVFIGENTNSKSLIAIKKSKKDIKPINIEADLLKLLNGMKGIPKLIHYMNFKNNKAIITNLCGPSLDKLHFFCDCKFNEIIVLLIGINILKILRAIHTAGVIHRDLKPANICYGSFSGKLDKFDKSILLIDFGLGNNILIRI